LQPWTTKQRGAAYALEGNIYITGAVVQWLGQTIGRPNIAEEIEALAREIPDNQGVYIVPAFTGLGAPHWSAEARGLICGLTRGATPAHLARAALESIAYQVNDVLAVIDAESGRPPAELLADGGASRNDLLMQFQADIAARPVIRNLSAEVSALGAAYLAGLAVGVWASEDEIAALPRRQERFEPRLPAAERQRLLAGWRDALDRTLLKN
jgi:glycerol kinase